MYVTAAEISTAIQGDNRLYGPEGILAGRADNASVHPFLDSQIVLSMQEANIELRRGGWSTPLSEPLSDEVLKSAIIGLTVGNATRSSSSREPWIDAMELAARAYLKMVGDGDAAIIGGELEDDGTDLALSAGAFDDPRPFAYEDPLAGVNSVFPDIGNGPRRWN
jgi:hypothetical protein